MIGDVPYVNSSLWPDVVLDNPCPSCHQQDWAVDHSIARCRTCGYLDIPTITNERQQK